MKVSIYLQLPPTLPDGGPRGDSLPSDGGLSQVLLPAALSWPRSISGAAGGGAPWTWGSEALLSSGSVEGSGASRLWPTLAAAQSPKDWSLDGGSGRRQRLGLQKPELRSAPADDSTEAVRGPSASPGVVQT